MAIFYKVLARGTVQFCRLGVLLMLFAVSAVSAEKGGFTLEQLMMPGELIEGHGEYRNQCDKCHSEFDDQQQNALCRDCHEKVDEDIDELMGYHGNIMQSTVGESVPQCRSCHTDHIGEQADIVNLNKGSFDHRLTDFELTGEHGEINCGGCHQEDKLFRDAPQACNDCHQEDDRHDGGMGDECGDCHDTAGWDDTSFDHSDTEFALSGEHETVSCASCHPDQRYQETPDQCISCHLFSDIHAGNNGADCGQCHIDKGWDELQFDHDVDTDFVLQGSHKTVSCNACHEQGTFEDTPGSNCVNCHRGDDLHLGNNGEQCEDCHGEKEWRTVDFDHDAATDFSLLGVHAETSCGACHGSSEGELQTDCAACHQPDDVHAAGLGEQCEKCHNPEGWNSSVRFNHDLTRFPLLGMHSLTSCDACHLSQGYSDIDPGCSSCHDDSDSHDGVYTDSCGQCHNPNDWSLWIFDHNRQTDFELEGAHERLQCDQCHNSRLIPDGPRFADDKPVSCYACHRQDDVHRRRFGPVCERCHISESFNEIRIQQP